MMKFFLVNFVFAILCINSGYGQNDFKRDTLNFKAGQLVYDIDFFGLERHMNWGVISTVSKINKVRFRINNHTNVPIEIKKFSGDNTTLSWRTSEGRVTVPPNSFYEIQCLFSNELGNFQSNFKVKFKHLGTKHEIDFQTYGYVEKVNGFDTEGKKDGKWIVLNPDGNVQELQRYKNGIQTENIFYFYYPEGNLRLRMDELNHIHTYYYESGEKQYEMRADSRTDYSKTGIVYKLEKAHEISFYDEKGKLVRTHPQRKSEVLNSYEMLLEEEFYPNGNQKKRVYANGKQFFYSEDLNGCLVKQIDAKTQGIEQIYIYENCDVVARKSTKLALADGTGKNAYAISKGEFKNLRFITGTIEYYNEETGQLRHVREMRNERFTDVIWIDSVKYNEKNYNGKKQGMWISNHEEWGGWKLGADEIMMKGFFVDGEPRDTIFHFFRDGKVKIITLNSFDRSAPTRIYYSPSGNVVQKVYSYHNAKLKTPFKAVSFEAVQNGTISSMVKNDFTFLFKNEQIVERKSPIFSVDYAHSFSHVNQKQYTVAKGEFRNEYLYNGKIYYYNNSDVLLKTIRVSVGRIAGDRIVFFEDPALEKELLNQKAIDLDRNGYITQSEIKTIETLNIRGYWIESAGDFQLFPRLKTLKVGGHIVDPVYMKNEQELFKQVKLLSNKPPIESDDRRANGGRSRSGGGGYRGGGGVPIEPVWELHDVIEEIDLPLPPQPDSIHDFVEVEPKFPGGADAMEKFIAEHLTYPTNDSIPENRGVVYVGFVVNKDGSIEQVRIRKGITNALDQEAMRLIKSMPKWKPGEQAGKIVRTRFTLPIRFD